MARIYKQPSIVSGKSVKDILNMDVQAFNSLSKSDLQKVVGRLVSAGNKRLRNFEKRGESSPATRAVERSGGKFSTKGKSVNELRSEFARARNFLKSKTSTISGYETVKKATAEQLKKSGVDVTLQTLDEILKIYERLKEVDPNVATRGMKYGVLQEISSMIDGVDPGQILVEMQSRLSDIYEQEIEMLDGDIGVSGFFEI